MSKKEDVILWRQILVLIASCLHSFVGGMIHAFPSSLNREILQTNTTGIKATSDQASWIASCNGLSGILGFVILSPLLQVLGRKPVNISLNIFILIGWVILYYANSIKALVIGRAVQGLSLGGIYIVAMTLGECSHKKRRGYFMTLKKVSVATGSLACHVLALVYNWRQIVTLGAAVILLSTVLILICPESPAFLAMRGRFEESAEAYYWLFGNTLESKKEIKEIISAQMKSIEQKKQENNKSILFDAIKKVFHKEFLRPFFIVVFATLAMDACGRYFLLAYITQIMVEITGDVAISMYCSIISDVLLIVALSISCILIRLYNRRTILFSLGSVSVILMFLVSISLFFTFKFQIAGMKWLTSSLILLHGFISHVGLVPVIFALTAEIFPLELKGVGSFASGIIFSAFYSLTLKLTPLMIDVTGVGGTFAMYGMCVFISMLILYFILPETKDKTLQEIENEIRGESNRNTDHIDLLPN